MTTTKKSRRGPPRRRSRPPLDEVGDDPDYRFSLANERTFLANIRTSLALLAGGIAVIQLVPSFGVPGGRDLIGILLGGLSLLVSANSYRDWERHERAMRLGTSLPRSIVAKTLAIGTTAVSATALVLLIVAIARRR